MLWIGLYNLGGVRCYEICAGKMRAGDSLVSIRRSKALQLTQIVLNQVMLLKI